MHDAFVFFTASAEPEAWAAFTAVTVFAGVCMGFVGVGGVVIVPAAIAFLGMDAREAVASTIPGYVMASFAGTWAYRERIAEDPDTLRLAGICGAGAGGGGLVAAFALESLPSRGIAIFVALFVLAFSVRTTVKTSHERWAQRKADASLSGPATNHVVREKASASAAKQEIGNLSLL